MYNAERLAASLTPLLRADVHGDVIAPRVIRTADLRRAGLTRDAVASAVRAGLLVRARRGVYLPPGARDDVRAAVACGGRLACVSVLAQCGVFVEMRPDRPHLHFERSRALHAPEVRRQVWHWPPLLRTPHPAATTVGVLDALAQATSCQSPRAAVATLDSALHMGLVDDDDLDELFARVPARRRVLRTLVDARAESGTETLLRLMALSLGFRVEVQVRVAGVGRVDLVLDGWLVIECDSEAHHSGWRSQKSDRRRDLALAQLGMSSLRPVAEDILHHPERVRSALIGMRAARNAGANRPS